jgi:hypothetical protein
MENIHTVGAMSPEIQKLLDDARSKVIATASKTGEVLKGYASALCSAFNVVDPVSGDKITPWYDLKGKAKAGVKVEHARFIADMEDRKFDRGTIDNYWKRVKEFSGRPKSIKVTGSNSVDEKTKSDLKTLINRIFKAEEDGQECQASDFKGALIEVYQGLGGEVDNLG